jgi:hypothetical protein
MHSGVPAVKPEYGGGTSYEYRYVKHSSQKKFGRGSSPELESISPRTL